MAGRHLPFSALKWQMPSIRQTAEKICPRRLAKEFQNVCQAIWLAKEWLGAETGEHRRDSLLAVCAGENHAQIGPKAPGLAKDVRTGESRQGDVKEHGSEIVCMLSQQFNRGEAIGSFQHREAFPAKHCGDRNPQGFLVFHHEDRSASRPPVFPALTFRS